MTLRKKNNINTIVMASVGAIGLLIICCTGLLAFSFLNGGTTKPTAIVLASPLPIETIIAGTVEAARIQTQSVSPPIISTNTLIPAPIETQHIPTSPSKEAILSYYRTITDYATEYVADLEIMGQLLQQGDENTLLFDNTWKANISIALAEMQISGRRLGSITEIPVELQQADYWFKKASSENELLIVNLNTGIQNLDANSINRADENMNNVNLYFQNGMTEMTNVLSALSNSSIEPTATIFIFELQTEVARPTEYIYFTPTPFALATVPLATSSGGGTAVCSCSGDSLNCSSFSSHASAQSCFSYCMSQGKGDIHKLDQDGDGDACESLN